MNTADPVHFTLTPPECHMEIRNGYGTSGTRVTGPVHVGDPLTLLILMRSQWGNDALIAVNLVSLCSTRMGKSIQHVLYLLQTVLTSWSMTVTPTTVPTRKLS